MPKKDKASNPFAGRWRIVSMSAWDEEFIDEEEGSEPEEAEEMTTDTTTSGYSHTQKAPLCLILYGSALACIALAWNIGDAPAIYFPGGVGLLLAFLAPAFHHLTVLDLGEVLAIRFGPVPLFRRIIRYADIEKVEVGRTLLLDGWGIHMSIRGGWVWNLWGRDCVVVHLKNGVLRIGTDDADNLAGFLKKRMQS